MPSSGNPANPGTNIEQWLIACQRIGKLNNDSYSPLLRISILSRESTDYIQVTFCEKGTIINPKTHIRKFEILEISL